ncbi:DUF6868 family protein [Oceanicoccus sp. KOV_DT_Chl]|uniref:DUF6868 family protein n=1 Tax=Oceanicoccus sp. KOV_DT_Chl TaxID=1904639 RepID=UPI000C79A856|nr:hypothetical protein [Oceanicoccus sp. KOV_DT_Chl]
MEWEILRSGLAWCAVINYGVLLVWVLLFCSCRHWIFALHSGIFKITEQQFNVTHYAGMGLLKLLILVFNLGPYLVLRFAL